MNDENWGWVAALGFLASSWFIYVLLFRTQDGKVDWVMSRLWEGADGRASFSKFQYWLWTMVIIVCLVALWVARIISSPDFVAPIDEIPESLLGILGFSVGTALGAKSITSAYVDQGLVRKPTVEAKREAEEPSRTYVPVPSPARDLFADDTGVPELSKVQMFLFTLIAVIYFVFSVADRIDSGEKEDLVLPDVDSALLVLMGISSAGYIGKKLVTREQPTLKAIAPRELSGTTMAGARKPAADGEKLVVLAGNGLKFDGNEVLVIGPHVYRAKEKPDEIVDWTNTHIYAKVPADLTPGHGHPVTVIVGGHPTNELTLTVTG